ncbi:nucleotide-binding protein [Rhodocyclus tenuis]|uniref:Nucleotide-binding protein n=1 Tax=Rhodocyclus tenuis TaxID=1066 RepID=A0A840FV36_RHOTE|nr:nucleotide-binding protein [Rhodocyclus tenuis]MBB4245957.1 hypothetical protein [Rhodocyclus tenuis]
MKTLLAVCLIVTSTALYAADKAPSTSPTAMAVVKGEVLEVREVESYTYLRLKTADGETWAAVGKAPVKKGDKVSIEDVMVMSNFESRSLKKTFPTILFGNLAGPNGSPVVNPAAGKSAAAPSALPPGLGKTIDTSNIKVDKASGANARTVAEVFGKRAELKDKTVAVRGKVVKFSPDIMGKNWLHLRDGSGSDASKNNDLLVTSSASAKLGDIVTAQGVVHLDKDFGAGYAYPVLIEDAKLQP